MTARQASASATYLDEEEPSEQEVNVVWTPLWGSQADALVCPADEILYHGTRGPGKTDVQLMRFRSRVGLGYGKFWRGIILDVEYKNLDDLVAKAQRWFPQFNDGARWLSSPSDYKWVWPDGEELLFRQMKDKRDYAKYHGHEYPWIAWNELTKHPTPEVYDLMKSCNRSSFLPIEHTPMDLETGRYLTHDGRPLPEIPLELFSTTNPHGLGHAWVKKRMIDGKDPGEIYVETTSIFNPRTQEMEDVETTFCHLFGSYKENEYLSPTYIAGLTRIKDPNRRKAWLEGDWNIVAGGAIDDLWDPDVHVIPRFIIPKGWAKLDRSFDWASSAPFATCWWAEANGEEAEMPDGTKWCPPAGTLICFQEWYGIDTEAYQTGDIKGLKLTAGNVAKGIVKREAELKASHWIKELVRPGPADNQIRNVMDVETDTIERKMAKEGVRWEESDKSPGSRVIGLELFRGMLEASVTGEGPGIYFTSNCKYCISILPMLPRDPDNEEDVDTKYPEDHFWDAVRYRVLKGKFRYATELNLDFPI